MHDDSRKLGGWLVTMIVILGPLQFNAFRHLALIRNSFQPYFGEYPYLQNSVVAYQGCVGVSILIWLFTAWTIYQRERETLGKIRKMLVVGAGLRILGILIIPIFGGLPAESASAMLVSSMPSIVFAMALTIGFYLYLLRSKKAELLYGNG